MTEPAFSHEQLLREASLKLEDMVQIRKRRRDINRLGFAYQLAFIHLTNRLPKQQLLELIEELLTYVAVQLNIPTSSSRSIKGVARPSSSMERLSWLTSFFTPLAKKSSER